MQTASRTISVTFNPNSVFAQSFIDTMRKSKAFKINESRQQPDEFVSNSIDSPYDPAYVARAEKAMKGSFVKVDLDNFWG